MPTIYGVEGANRGPDLPSTQQEWHVFERHFGIWLRDNAHTVTAEEGRPFKKATYECLALGMSSGVAVSVLLNKVMLIKRPFTRRLFSIFTGLYTVALCINYKRRPIYATLLRSPGRVGDAARDILHKTRKQTNVSQSAANAQDNRFDQDTHSVEPGDDYNYGNKKEEFRGDADFAPVNVEEFNERRRASKFKPPVAGKYKTWDDIRRENQNN
ncbi:hypothetical protein BgAZ_101100 [Babesia gibsoni]|uniref:Uncharacterized protein n=1 Tax=Babesia gibsoni TaxID=33632 RepID=A0AAD8PF85_BABGI|nr:hypothetical protein BgAZ_101100 [Babesia gibsoni]